MTWGKGTTNNSIGWGKGADSNSISWGAVYPESLSGDTDIQSGLSNTVAPAISGTNEVGEVLTCTSGTWSGGTPITYAYQWKLDGVNIGGATNNTYTLISADAETDITCVVTATNAEGSNSATSNTVTIAAEGDADALAFISAAGITDPTQQSAVNQLVLDLKAASIWTKMKAVYPFVGGSASAHKWNLKDPQDTNGAYRLSFSGGWTHSSTGATPNGTNATASTFWEMNDVAGRVDNFHMSYYSRTQNPSGDGWVIGRGDTNDGDPLYGLAIKRGGSNLRIFDPANLFYRISSTETDGRGFYVGSATANNARVFYKNAGSIGSGSSVSAHATFTGYPVYLGAMNGPTVLYQNNECGFSSFGDGLNGTEVTALNNAVTTFQTTLSRNV